MLVGSFVGMGRRAVLRSGYVRCYWVVLLVWADVLS